MTELQRLAASFIAAQPGGPKRLLRIHQPDEYHRCRGCRTGGTGTPGLEWPCVVHMFAELASRLVADRSAAVEEAAKDRWCAS